MDYYVKSILFCISSNFGIIAAIHNPAEVWIGHSRSLEDRNPAVARMLTNITLSPETINEWALKIGRDKENPVEVAEAWVSENMDIVDKWIYE